VGPKNDEKQVARIASATTAQRGPSIATSHARASMMTPRARSVDIRISRRSNRSATIPAGIERKTYGSTLAAPTIPSSTGSELSW
jgi:hypothetical protein